MEVGMKTLTTRDASVLAVIAGSPSLSRDQRKRLMERLSSAAKPIAEAMGNGTPTTASKSTRVARAVKDWSDSNRDASKARMLRRLA
jgi:malate/lactate dehydrogenase